MPAAYRILATGPDGAVYAGLVTASSGVVTHRVLRVRADGVVDTSYGAAGEANGQELVEVAGERPVAAADGRHLDDLAPDQLDAVVFAEDAGLGHPVILRPREPSPRRRHLDRHRAPPGSRWAYPIAWI